MAAQKKFSLALIVGLAAATLAHAQDAPKPVSYISRDEVQVRPAPSPQLPLGYLSRGNEVEVLQRCASWVRVRVKRTGSVGWVSQSFIADQPQRENTCVCMDDRMSDNKRCGEVSTEFKIGAIHLACTIAPKIADGACPTPTSAGGAPD